VGAAQLQRHPDARLVAAAYPTVADALAEAALLPGVLLGAGPVYERDAKVVVARDAAHQKSQVLPAQQAALAQVPQAAEP